MPSDLPPDLPPEDVALLLAAVDGVLDDAQASRLMADPALQREADEHRAVRAALAGPVTPLPAALRERLLANALGTLDDAGDSGPPTPVVPLRTRRRPLARAGAIAATAAATLAVLGGLSLLGGPGGVDTASDLPATATVAKATDPERATAGSDADGSVITAAGAETMTSPEAAGGNDPARAASDTGDPSAVAAGPPPSRLPAPLTDLDGLRVATRDLLDAPPAGAARCTPPAGTTRGVVRANWQGTDVEVLFVADGPDGEVTSLEVRDETCTLLASLALP